MRGKPKMDLSARELKALEEFIDSPESQSVLTCLRDNEIFASYVSWSVDFPADLKPLPKGIGVLLSLAANIVPLPEGVVAVEPNVTNMTEDFLSIWNDVTKKLWREPLSVDRDQDTQILIVISILWRCTFGLQTSHPLVSSSSEDMNAWITSSLKEKGANQSLWSGCNEWMNGACSRVRRAQKTGVKRRHASQSAEFIPESLEEILDEGCDLEEGIIPTTRKVESHWSASRVQTEYSDWETYIADIHSMAVCQEPGRVIELPETDAMMKAADAQNFLSLIGLKPGFMKWMR
mgnify:FL=1